MAPQSALQEASQEFWLGRTNANHRFSDEEWLKKYADEILSAVPQGGTLLDIGCGSCQVTAHLASAFERIVAIDSSDTMIVAARERIATLGIKNISVMCGSAFELPAFAEGRADVILSYALVQYFTRDELRRHLEECERALSDYGVIFIGLVPEIANQERYYFGYLIPNFSRLRRLPSRIALFCLRARALLRGDVLWDGIGNWFSKEEVARLAKDLGLATEFHDAAYSDYRFHAVLRATKGYERP